MYGLAMATTRLPVRSDVHAMCSHPISEPRSSPGDAEGVTPPSLAHTGADQHETEQRSTSQRSESPEYHAAVESPGTASKPGSQPGELAADHALDTEDAPAALATCVEDSVGCPAQLGSTETGLATGGETIAVSPCMTASGVRNIADAGSTPFDGASSQPATLDWVQPAYEAAAEQDSQRPDGAKCADNANMRSKEADVSMAADRVASEDVVLLEVKAVQQSSKRAVQEADATAHAPAALSQETATADVGHAGMNVDGPKAVQAAEASSMAGHQPGVGYASHNADAQTTGVCNRGSVATAALPTAALPTANFEMGANGTAGSKAAAAATPQPTAAPHNTPATVAQISGSTDSLRKSAGGHVAAEASDTTSGGTPFAEIVARSQRELAQAIAVRASTDAPGNDSSMAAESKLAAAQATQQDKAVQPAAAEGNEHGGDAVAAQAAEYASIAGEEVTPPQALENALRAAGLQVRQGGVRATPGALSVRSSFAPSTGAFSWCCSLVC